MFLYKLVVALIVAESIGAAPVPANHSCNSAALCSGKLVGKPNQTEQYPYAPDTQFFYACVRNAEDSASSNVGCLQCPQSRTFSATCKQCLSSLDAANGNCYNNTDAISTGAPVTLAPCNTAGFCSSKPNGTYKNPDNPSQFFSCISGEATACQLCNDGLVYVEECKRCKYANEPVDCQQNVPVAPADTSCTPANACENKMNGDYEAGENLNDFHSCSNGLCTKKNCPGSLVFSTVCEVCSAKYYKSSDECPSQDKPVDIQALQAQAPTCPENFCAGKAQDFYIDPVNSYMGYHCLKTQLNEDWCIPEQCNPTSLVYKKGQDGMHYCDYV